MTVARALAQWAHAYRATPDDLALAERAVADTVAVALAARAHPLCSLTAPLPDAARWAAMAHVLDFDDLHTATTAPLPTVNWRHVDNGKITAIRVTFDPRPLTSGS